jgi:formate C-acetyltransferase
MTNILMKEIKKDPDLRQYTLKNLPLLKTLKARYEATQTAVCIERAKYITAYMKNPKDPDEPTILTRARAVYHYLSSREPIFHNDNPIAGSSTSKEVGAPVYPELLGISIWPELDTISTRKANPQRLTEEEAEILNFDVFPFWMDRTILETTRKKLMDEKSPTLKALKLMEKIAFFMAGKTTVISHTTPFYEKVLAKGLNAMIEEARQKANAPGPDEQEKKTFFQAMQIAMEGIINYAQNLSKKAAELAANASSNGKMKHFQEMADICARVPARPAESFREAINSLWLCHVGVLAENVNMATNPGRLDQVLYPYFKKDVEQNKITVEEALTLIGCLWFKISDNTNLVPESAEKMFGGAGSVPAVTLGGITKEGTDAVNDLTYLMLKVTELLPIKDPNVNARYHYEINDRAYMERVSRVIIGTAAIPATYNDKVNIATLENQGVSTEHARDYAVIGCVELGSAGREYASTSSILLNLGAAVDMTLYNGKRPYITGDLQIGPQTGEPEDLNTFEAFQKAFESQLKALVEMAIALNEELGRMHQKHLPTPLLSCFFEGPMEKGKDLIFGGALYNSSGVTHVAFADVCDSLNAVEAAVYLDKKATLAQMREAVEKNFEGYEDLHAYVKNKAPKYGMDDSDESHPIAVKNSQRLIRFLYDLYQSHTNYRGGKYRPAYWTMTNHAGLGKIGRALPSGRKAYEVFSSGITPASQCARDLTGAYKSVAELGSKYIPGGVALNMKYTPEASISKNGSYLKHFTNMAEGYFKSGGMQVQYNIQTYETLEDARKHPEKYPQLIVRVSGYSAYFKDLNDAMKHELITRTQYNLDTGKAVPYPGTDKGGKE